MPTLAEILSENTRAGELWEPLDERRIRCFACGHECPIFEGQTGVCKVRFNRGGELRVPWGYVAAAHCDPIEKKPFFHVRPGSLAFSFGMNGCDLHCSFCQNWVTSQALRDPVSIAPVHHTTPEALVRAAVESGADAVISTYNEPLITSEWAVAVFREAKAAGLLTGYVSNGNANPRVLEYLRPWTDLYKVDLKAFNDRRYRELGGRLEPVLDSLKRIHEMGFWLEVVTLVVPGFNDSDGELRAMADYIAGVSPDIPWHVTAFHGDYKMTGPGNTAPAALARAAEIGKLAGLRYVYAGNLPGMTGGLEDTRCSECGAALVRRRGFRILERRITAEGRCPDCATAAPGVWWKADARTSI
ncbi:MAG: AmmeMemoRadiSam system radical SAM enzyme [bacterium]